uniref:[Ala1,Thr6]-bradykinyl-Ser n=1 Tax=Physalaemus signifer TaxID=364768 RepID=BRK3_PHYSG|nr:RecName: Full=[Ala1,Thr6]-bradykinyl-Ser [Physalaemus signifer]
APPGFTPFRS